MRERNNDIRLFEKIKLLAMDCSCGLMVLFFTDELQEEVFTPEVYFSIEKGVEACSLIKCLVDTAEKIGEEKKRKREKIFQNYWGLSLNSSTKEIVVQTKEQLENILMSWGKGKIEEEKIMEIINSIIIFSSKSWQIIVKKMIEGGKIDWDEIMGAV